MADERKDAVASVGFAVNQGVLGAEGIKNAFEHLWRSCYKGDRSKLSVPVITQRMDGTEAQKLLVRTLVHGVTSTATASVSSRVHEAFQLVGADGSVSPLPTTAQALQDHPLATPSPFGDLVSGTTKVDTTVRHAFDILGKHLQVDKGLNADLAKLFKVVTGADCTAELYKMCVYPVGTGFSMHQDTPLPGMLGTAVVELYRSRPWNPAHRTGGDLVLEVNGEATVVDGDYAVVFLPWVRHCVTPVRMGHRVSALFRIYRSRHADGDEAKADASTAPSVDVEGVVDDTDVEQEWRKPRKFDDRRAVSPVVLIWGRYLDSGPCVRTKGYRDVDTCAQALTGLASSTAKPRRLFVVLTGVYSNDQLKDMASGTGGSALLGFDRQLHDALIGKGMEVAVSPCALVHAITDTEGREPGYDICESALHLVYLDGEDIEMELATWLPWDGSGRHHGLRSKGRAAPVFARRLADTTHVRDLFVADDAMNSFAVVLNTNKQDYGVTLYQDYEPFVSATANETEYGYSNNLYFSVCLVVQQAVPEV